MDRNLQILEDACAVAGVKRSDIAEYRISATEVRFTLKDGKSWALELVNFNPDALIRSEAVNVREVPAKRAKPRKKAPGLRDRTGKA